LLRLPTRNEVKKLGLKADEQVHPPLSGLSTETAYQGMWKMHKLVVFIVIFVLTIIGPNHQTAMAGWFGPSNYDECILDGMKGVTSDLAARAVAGACARKFRSKSKTETTPTNKREIPPVLLDKYGRKLCRVVKEGGRWVYAEKSYADSGMDIYKLSNDKGDYFEIISPREPNNVTKWEGIRILGVCRDYFLQRTLQGR